MAHRTPEGRKEQESAPSPVARPRQRWVGKIAAGLVLALAFAGAGYFGWTELEEWRMAEEERWRLGEKRIRALEVTVKRLVEERDRKAAEEQAKLAAEAERKRLEAEEEERKRREAEEKARRMAPEKVFQDTLRSGGKGPRMAVLPAGSFRMGCLSNDDDCFDEEKPVRQVRIPRPFAVSVHEVTFEDYDRFARATDADMPGDGGLGRGRRPVILVSWEDAKAYVAWLSSQTGEEYRLLSEAEWEYAARAGTRTKYSWGDEVGSNRANCDGCGSRWDNQQTAPVGSFAPNAFGLYDMHGNVLEWVEDCWSRSYQGAPFDGSAWLLGDCRLRVLRGGSWGLNPWFLRAANRVWGYTDGRDGNGGFRVARTLAP